MAEDLSVLMTGIDKFTSALGNEGAVVMFRAIGSGAVDDVSQAVRHDIRDNSMSGWRRSKPVQISGRYEIQADTLVILPTAAGPMRVLEDGRNHGNPGGFQGPGVNRKTGTTARTKAGKLRKVRATGGHRWNGTTRGKGTWGDAVETITRESVVRGEKALLAIAVKSLP